MEPSALFETPVLYLLIYLNFVFFQSNEKLKMIEEKAMKIASTLNAEYWTVSSKSSGQVSISPTFQ
jgi:hypothetical protein